MTIDDINRFRYRLKFFEPLRFFSFPFGWSYHQEVSHLSHHYEKFSCVPPARSTSFPRVLSPKIDKICKIYKTGQNLWSYGISQCSSVPSSGKVYLKLMTRENMTPLRSSSFTLQFSAPTRKSCSLGGKILCVGACQIQFSLVVFLL